MKQIIRTNDTPNELVAAAADLFADKGYDGASIRAITDRARTNLGSITYHFGSKEALYDAVFDVLVGPLPDLLVEAAGTDGPPLDRIERVVRALFAHLQANPSIPRLMMQHLASTRALPEPARKTLGRNVSLIGGLISAGQADGSIRKGNATLMALSVGSQPVFLNLIRQALRESTDINQDDPGTGREVGESVVHFIRAGLAANSSQRP